MKNFTIKILILTLTFFVLSNVLGQTISYPPNFKFKTETFKSESLGVANQNFYYKISFVKNPKVPDNKTVAIGILQIGENYSKFIDIIQLQRDSVIEKQSHQSTINADEFDVLLKLKTQWETIVVKDFKDKNIFIHDWARKTYQYEIQNPVFNWKLKEGTKNILGYDCGEAETVFKGRTYTAWYAKKLPIINGPYVFGGLPGLIMEISDSKNEYDFTLIGIDKKKKNIYTRTEDNILKVSREQFRKIIQSYNDNPGFYSGKAYNPDGSEITGRLQASPYNPIELE